MLSVLRLCSILGGQILMAFFRVYVIIHWNFGDGHTWQEQRWEGKDSSMCCDFQHPSVVLWLLSKRLRFLRAEGRVFSRDEGMSDIGKPISDDDNP